MKLTAFRMANWSLSHRDSSRFGPSSRWSNKDMDPVLPEDRTWTTWDYIAYWVSDATNAGIWQLASSMLAVGLSWRQALPAIAVGNIIIAVGSPNITPNFGPVQALLLAGYIDGDGFERYHWSETTHRVSGSEPLVFWFLVELLQCRQSCGPFYVLVWGPGMHYCTWMYSNPQGSYHRHLQVRNASIKC